MNAGQYLVALSGLPSGSAADHLLAIQAGTGTGPGQTVFAAKFSVVTGEDRFDAVRKPLLLAPRWTVTETKTAHITAAAVTASMQSERIVVTTRRKTAVVTQDLAETVVHLNKTRLKGQTT